MKRNPPKAGDILLLKSNVGDLIFVVLSVSVTDNEPETSSDASSYPRYNCEVKNFSDSQIARLITSVQILSHDNSWKIL